MDEDFKDKLCAYLGELTYEYEHCHDWIRQSGLATKINAANSLLGFDGKKQTFLDQAKEILKSLHQ